VNGVLWYVSGLGFTGRRSVPYHIYIYTLFHPLTASERSTG